MTNATWPVGQLCQLLRKSWRSRGGGGGGLLEENYWKLEEDTLWNCLVSPLE